MDTLYVAGVYVMGYLIFHLDQSYLYLISSSYLISSPGSHKNVPLFMTAIQTLNKLVVHILLETPHELIFC